MAPSAGHRYLSTYYFKDQDLCMVPRHIREDTAWMEIDTDQGQAQQIAKHPPFRDTV